LGRWRKIQLNYRNYFILRFDKKINQVIYTPVDSEDFLWSRKNTDKVAPGKIKVLFVGDLFTEGHNSRHSKKRWKN
jgi:hypothetical protein